MKRSTARILTTHVGSLIRPPALIEFLRAQQERKPVDEAAFAACLTASVAEVVRQQAEAGIDVVSDGEFGKTISWSQYVLERLSGFERRPIKAGANPFARGADRTRFAEFYAELDARDAPATAIRGGLRRPDRLYRPGRAPARHRQLQGGAGEGPGGRGVPAGRGARERHPRPQERVLRERGRLPAGDRRGDAHRIPHDRRCRLPGAARRCPHRRHLRPHGAAGELRRLPRLGRALCRGGEPRARRHPRGPRALSRLLGKLAGAAHHRRAAARHRRPHPARCASAPT